jgi:hypothetical protein
MEKRTQSLGTMVIVQKRLMGKMEQKKAEEKV